ncbi:MAG: Asp-tRNA(Asn)/Glu-tRNA(Gln) amidotransferase subunit GatA [Promethearchaeota archaeon]
MSSLYSLSGLEIKQKLENGEITSEDVVLSCFERIEKVESKIHAYVEIFKKEAVENAKKIDKLKKQGKKLGELAGIPIAIKDIISVKGHQTSASSKMLEGYIAPYDSTVVKRLIREHQAIVIGTTNMDEFAMGSSTESSYYGPTYNPWNLKYVPGGSSGGSAAAISADETILALGTDTGGSIRCPAAYCGVAGIKPTYGRVSRYGIIAYANSLEQVGPISKTVEDSALLLKLMAGKDPFDATTVDVKVDDYLEEIKKGIENLTIGIPKDFFGQGLNPEVEKNVKNAIKTIEKEGNDIIEVSLPHIEYALPTYYLIAMSEASSNLARYDGIRYGYCTKDYNGNFNEVFSKTRGEGFGPEVRRRIILGTYALSAGYFEMFYIKALKVRNLIRKDFTEAFNNCNILIGPTMPSTAFEIGTKLEAPIQMYLEDILTVPINLAGIPSMSINCGFSSQKLPIGLQIMGNFYKESEIFRVAYHIEQKLQLFKKKPNL